LNFYKFTKPILFKLNPESAHDLVFAIAKIAQRSKLLCNYLEKHYSTQHSILESEVFGIRFSSPIGLAAGFDKNGQIVRFIRALGFGFMEIGSVSNMACSGNPKPRLFRLEKDTALINRMGLNNVGPNSVISNLSQHTPLRHFVLGINITKTNDSKILGQEAIKDIVNCYNQLNSHASFVVLNISCPNTEDGKTFEAPESLNSLLHELYRARSIHTVMTPLLVKFSPDSSIESLSNAVSICENYGVDGYVLVNTTSKRDSLRTSTNELENIGYGGLSGDPLFPHAIDKIRLVFGLTKGRKAIIGVGGVSSAISAYKMICAGASLIELYTGMVYEGPGICKRINSGLIKLLEKDNFSNITEAIGIDNKA
jgi:dihydroorotate dehydrogenase